MTSLAAEIRNEILHPEKKTSVNKKDLKQNKIL